MFFRALRAERMKLRRSQVWLAFFILPILPAFLGTFNYLQNTEILTEAWYSLWTQFTLFLCYFFLPALIGVYSSYLLRLEHTRHNWYGVLTSPVPSIMVYLAKLSMVSIMVVLTQIWMGILFIISGLLAGLQPPLPAELFLWMVLGVVGGIVIGSVQLCISLVIHSFAVPVGIAFVGGIVALPVLSKGYGVWYPYSLLSLGMSANGPTEAMQFSLIQFLLNGMIFVLICIIFAGIWFAKRDVATG